MSISQITLTNMPAVAMNNILKYTDFRSIVVLRKVSRDLQNFIDDVKPDLHLTSIDVEVSLQEKIGGVLRLNSRMESRKILYKKFKNGCQIVCGRKKKILENVDFTKFFTEELEYILSHQKSFLNSFRLSISSQDTKVLKHLKLHLKSREHQLQVKNFQMESDDQQISHILPYISPKFLKRIQLKLSKPLVAEIEELENLEQWRHAEELFTENLIICAPIQNFVHFSRAEITLYKVTVEELFFMKETFLHSSNFQHFILRYKYFVSEELTDLQRRILEERNILQLFGQSFSEDFKFKDKKWYFRSPNSDDHVLYMFFSYRHSRFVRVPLSMVPKNAFSEN